MASLPHCAYPYFAPQDTAWYQPPQSPFPRYEVEDSTSSASSYSLPPEPRIPSPPSLNTPTHPTSQPTKPKKRGKVNSNKKEARRNKHITEAFRDLQSRIPNTPEPHQAPLPRIKTLRLAMRYIQELKRQLGEEAGDSGMGEEGFAAAVAAELQTRNSYKLRAEQELKEQSSLPGPSHGYFTSLASPYTASASSLTPSFNASLTPSFGFLPKAPFYTSESPQSGTQ